MATAPLATTDDLQTWLGATFTGDEWARAELLLVAVSNLVRSHCRKTWETGTIPETVHPVVLTVAARVWRNPEAATSYSITNGPFGKSMTFSNPAAVGLYLGPDDKAALPAPAGSGGGLRVIGTTRGDPWPDTTYVPTVDGPPFPWYGGDVS